MAGRERQRPGRSWMAWGAAAAALLTKSKTVLPLVSKLAMPVSSMLASVFTYAWAYRSWTVGIGFVAMLFIHEIGHVLAAKRKGLPVSAPVFIPFVGALIAMKRHPRDAATEAFVALGGPLLGTMGALAALAAGLALESTALVLVAYAGFFINLINLLPIRPLDGGRIAGAVTRWLWAVGLVAGLAVILVLRSILFLVVYALFVAELYRKYATKRQKRTVVLTFAASVPAERLAEGFVPGEQHRRRLDFATWSGLDGIQRVETAWEAVGLRETVELPEPLLVGEVRLAGFRPVRDERGETVRYEAGIEIVGEPHENDRYHDIPARVRWAFGAAYFGLAALLAGLMAMVHRLPVAGFPG